MNKPMNKFCLAALFCGFFFLLSAQDTSEQLSKFNKYEAFAPLFMEGYVNAYHSATGNPGPDYWQNRANYKIKATLDTVNQQITGEETITYINNSPYQLHELWMQLDQNTFRKDARSTALYPDDDRNGVKNHTRGYLIKSVEVNGDKAAYVINDTRMQIRLAKPVKADGKKVKIHITYSFDIPFHGKDRMGKVKTENGWIYTLAQWYPRMAVYDEVKGWNNLPYLGTGEFYLEYGSFDYEVTVPANMIVVGSGILQNPGSVLTKEAQERLKKARESDKTVTILSKEEMLAGTHHREGKDGMLTWHFKINNSRDVAWAASNAFIWDAARINFPDGTKGLAQSVYPEENSGQDGYGRSTEYTKNCIELYSKDWFQYPYKVATNVGAHELGMEYPGIVFCSYKSQGSDLWGVINHEFGHTWFPMIVGSNERIYGWMDEGLNTFINDISTQQFNNGEYASPEDFQSMGSYIFDESLDPVFTRADVIHSQQNLGIEAYYKPSTALNVLRNVVLGPKRFDYAFKTYINRWKFKHPQPWDFFNTMSNASGEDLGWFFRGWFMHNWKNDQGVKSIEYVDDDATKGAKITLMNYGKMAMPVLLQINFADGSVKNVRLPVEIWMTGPEYVYHVASTSKIRSVIIDPEHLVPDANALNNKLLKLTPAPKNITATDVIDNYIQAIGGKAKLAGIQDMSIVRTTTFRGFEMSLIEKMKRPDMYLQDIQVMGNSLVKFVVNGDSVNVYQRGEKQEIGPDAIETIKERLKNQFPELHYKDRAVSLKLLGIQETNDSSFYVIQVSDSTGVLSKDFYDTKSGLKIRSISSEGDVSNYSDYATYNGILLPKKSSTSLFGGSLELTIKEAKINQGVADSDFK